MTRNKKGTEATAMNTAILTTNSPTPAKAVNSALWAAQILLGLAFGMAGLLKSTQPIATLGEQMPWVHAVPEAMVRFIGVAEFAGALGLLLPSLARVKPALTPLAALGLVAIMALASLFHLGRHELSALPVNIVLAGLALFVAWGRTKRVPITAR
jgi:hypothetical protein